MFFEGLLLSLVESAWTLILHLSARSSFPKPLPPDEEAALVAQMLDGNTQARDKLIEHNLRLVAHIAKKYTRDSGDADDLISIGSIGLIKAVHTFKPEAGKLTTYASRCIENAILSQMRLWFQTSTPRAEKNPNGVFWHRFPRISTSFVPLRTAM